MATSPPQRHKRLRPSCPSNDACDSSLPSASVATNTSSTKANETCSLARWLPLCRAVPSRRHAFEALRQGLVTVNGEVCKQPSRSIRPTQDVIVYMGNIVEYHGRDTKSNRSDIDEDFTQDASATVRHVHVIMNKPPGTLCARNHCRQVQGGSTIPDTRPTVYDIITEQLFNNSGSSNGSDRSPPPHCVPIGRLDVDTTGLLLLTSDGLLNNSLANPLYKVDKVYRAILRDTRKPLSDDAIQKLRTGVYMKPGGGKAAVCVKGEATNVKSQVGVVDLRISGGYNHQVKHMLRLVGRPLAKLHRLEFAGIRLCPEELPEGRCRHLTAEEASQLYALAHERKMAVDVGSSTGETNSAPLPETTR